jgi:peptidoglycan/xylan/chitin deacetylase (PgdA/CDA1 family)
MNTVSGQLPSHSSWQEMSLIEFGDSPEELAFQKEEKINFRVLTQEAKPKPSAEKVVFLTFDDGPSPRVTPLILQTLKKHNIKATFFLIGRMVVKYPKIAKKVRAEGHLICNHTFSHQYKKIYQNTDAFMEDLKKCETIVKGSLGEGFTTNIIRFPAGSFEKKKVPFRERVLKEGYVYIDWNALNGDAEGREKTVEQLVQRAKNTIRNKKNVVILMHDANTNINTAKALSAIINYLKAEGYTFKMMDEYPFQ